MAVITFVLLFTGGCNREKVNTAGINIEPVPHRAIKPALIRLEDVGPGGPYQSEENLHKLYVIADYLHSEGVPFHVSLIPRIVVPSRKYDVSISDGTPYTNVFVRTIKNMEKMGGIMGVHGYTHQSGKDSSAFGFEFYNRVDNPSVPDTYEFARERTDKAYVLFEKTGIIPAYWETPHYTASIKQHPAFEEQSGLLYENNHRGEMVNFNKVFDHAGNGFRGFITVPAPLGNIDKENDVDKMLKRLDKMEGDLASFFYHPFREFRFMYKEKNDKGEPYYVYDKNSPLHVLIRGFKEKGYTFVSIHSLVKFVPAQRLGPLPFSEGDMVLTGHFVEGRGKEILVWNKNSSQWNMYQYTAPYYSPRRPKAFADMGVVLAGWVPENDGMPLVGDFTGNGKDDLMIYSPGKGTFKLLENVDGKFIPREKAYFTMKGIRPANVLAGNFNGDELADVAVYDRENQRVGLSLNTGRGFKKMTWQSFDILKGNNIKLLAGDFNGNRKTDLAVLDTGSGQWDVLIAEKGTFSTSIGPWMKSWGSGDKWKPFSSDINGDGLSDLLLYSKTGQWQLAVSNGKSFVYKGEFGPWGSSQRGLPLVADLNGDNKSDLIIADGLAGKDYNLDTAISVME